MKFKLLKFFVLLFLISSCIKKEDEIFVINPLKFSDNKLTLSMIADEVAYIPLDNSYQIGSIYSIKMNRKGIFISTKNPGILHFDNYGKFVRVIARKGKGPDEYLYGMSFTVDEKNDKVYVITKDKIRIFSLNGFLIKDISTSEYFDGLADDIEIYNSRLFLADYGTDGAFKYNWVFIDTLGNIISKKYSSVQSTGFIPAGNEYMFENELLYFNLLNDTVFSILPDFQFKAAYLFAQGDFRFPNNLVLNSTSQLNNYFIPKNMFESKHYIFLRYSLKDRSATLMVDKKSKKTYQSFKEKKVGGVVYKEACILNDMDGGLSLSPIPLGYYFYIEKGVEYIITLIYPFDLKLYISSNEFKNTTPKFPEKKKALERLANSLNENDNPVLMLVKLKE